MMRYFLPILFALVWPASLTSAVAQTTMWAVGEVNSSCGQYVQAADGERKARPPGAAFNLIYDRNYDAFMNATDGFLTGANAHDSVHATAGEGTDAQGRMSWLENYCRSHPLDKFIEALFAFRTDLISRSVH
jgi:hypothetical protein